MDEHGTLTEEEERRTFGGPDPEPPPVMRATPLDMSKATPDLLKALAAAQAQVDTVTKAARKAAGNNSPAYNYATADSMIRGGREARIGTGLALLTSWSFEELEPPRNTESGQWPGALVTMHFVLTHESGGTISGALAVHAICSRGRPIDKAVTAAATYAEGFIERNLMRLDRAEEGADDVERRQETDTAPAQPRQQRQQASAVVSAPVVSLVALLDKVTTEEALALAKENARGKFRGMNPAEKQATTAAIVRAEERCKPPITKPAEPNGRDPDASTPGDEQQGAEEG